MATAPSASSPDAALSALPRGRCAADGRRILLRPHLASSRHPDAAGAASGLPPDLPPLLLCAARLLNSRAQITVLRDPSLDLLLQSPWPWLVAGALIRVWTGGRQEPGPIGSLLSALLLSPRSKVEPSSETSCSGWCLMTTLTRVSASGQELGRITGVTAIYPGGWVLRYTNPQEAAALAEREAAASRQERAQLVDSWSSSSQDIVGVDSGASADVTGMGVKPHRVPTGPGLLATRPGERTGEGRVRAEPVFWLSATDDGAPHTEGLEAFEEQSRTGSPVLPRASSRRFSGAPHHRHQTPRASSCLMRSRPASEVSSPRSSGCFT